MLFLHNENIPLLSTNPKVCSSPIWSCSSSSISLLYSLSPACYVQTRWFGNNTFTYVVVIILLVNALQSTICNWHCIFYLPLLSIRTFIHKIFMSVSTNVLYHLATKPNPIILTTILCESSIPPCSLQRSVAQQFSGVQDKWGKHFPNKNSKGPNKGEWLGLPPKHMPCHFLLRATTVSEAHLCNYSNI